MCSASASPDRALTLPTTTHLQLPFKCSQNIFWPTYMLPTMPADRLLNQVLAQYQTTHDARQTDRLFGTTLTLLTELSNPLNLAVLTSQFLTAPAIWHRPPPTDPLRDTCLRVLSLYNTAAIHVRRNELENDEMRKEESLTAGWMASWMQQQQIPPVGGGLKTEAWARAVVKGADERSSRWQHLLVLAGILMGFEGDDRHGLSSAMRGTLEQAVVTAANLALRTLDREPPVARAAVVLAMNWAFPLLSDVSRTAVDCDALLPVAVHALLGDTGLEGGLFLGAVAADVNQIGSRLDWPEASPSFATLRQFSSKPLVGTAGPLSRMIAYALERTRSHQLVLQTQTELLRFSANLLEQWRGVKLAEVDVGEEGALLTGATIETTWPELWRLLTNVLFAVVAILRSVTARSLLDPNLRNDEMAPVVASNSLHIYRNLYFIASRGNESFQVYTFSYMASIDTLARYAEASIAFLRATMPSSTTSIPTHALPRALDLFFLNTAEHLPLNLPAEACESLIVQPATAYLSNHGPNSKKVVELFEAAHAAVLSVLSCPQNGPIAVRMAPFYAEALLESFPSHISPRQFRLAFSTLMQILSPPFPVSATQPELAETLLEMVRFRVAMADQRMLAATQNTQDQAAAPPMSEQSALVLTLIDALPYLSLPILEEWMEMAARVLHEISDAMLQEAVKYRFWEILGSGEMDVERAAVGVAWWGTKGGRELVLFGPNQGNPQELVMSGAIVDDAASSRL